MCGIAGRWLQAAPSVPIEAALDLLQHRGPDDRGIWKSAGNALELGHTRLAIIDPSDAGHQPMTTPDGRVVLVYNGELYNSRELRANLEARGHRFRGGSDTEVVLGMYLQFGPDMLSRLNGMFALAVFDRSSGELWLARDALGVKPLYFAQNHHGFAFASELKALLRLMPIDAALDVQALHRYLTFLWCPGTATPLAGVSRLAPGEQLRVRAGQVIARRVWAPAPFLRASSPAPSVPSAAREVAEALRSAVERQLVADVPVGAMLSGGLDSSAIVAFARRQLPNLDCFTIVPEGGHDAGDTSDVPYARRVARHLDVRLHEVPIRAAQMAAELPRMVYQLDEPLADLAPLNVLFMSQLARQHGVKVLLSGTGGDDLFSGYRRHRALCAERAWQWLPGPVRRGLRLGTTVAAQAAMRAAGSAGGRGAAAAVWARRAAKAFAHADQSPDARLLGYFGWGEPTRLGALFAREHQAQLSPGSLYAPMLERLAALPAGLSPLDRMLALEQRFFLGDHNLPYADKMSMAASVEVRVPFLDPDLVTLANRLPAALKQRGRHGKWILKRAMEPFLPRDVIYRPKTGFGAPLRRWLEADLAELVADVLSPARLRERGLFDPARVHALIDQNRRGEVDGAYPILSLCCIELWCRQFVDGVRPARALGEPERRVPA